ncbi:hypothetical protein L1987_47006 [Smallanthus sonchifolius]|uniref:Uncharacterized protein n=1 Tax=Smallanthus sonchifolius TaxID=185202 RepID=A0ACB9G103_9ASTR|nr:hypothetical protein L1987_47006 [Smallanthus sonchifolius]
MIGHKTGRRVFLRKNLMNFFLLMFLSIYIPFIFSVNNVWLSFVNFHVIAYILLATQREEQLCAGDATAEATQLSDLVYVVIEHGKR